MRLVFKRHVCIFLGMNSTRHMLHPASKCLFFFLFEIFQTTFGTIGFFKMHQQPWFPSPLRSAFLTVMIWGQIGPDFGRIFKTTDLLESNLASWAFDGP